MFQKGGGNSSGTAAGGEEERVGTDGILKGDCRLRTVRTVFLRILIFPVKKEASLEFRVTYLYEHRRRG